LDGSNSIDADELSEAMVQLGIDKSHDEVRISFLFCFVLFCFVLFCFVLFGGVSTCLKVHNCTMNHLRHFPHALLATPSWGALVKLL
jgi:hypothetical protein